MTLEQLKTKYELKAYTEFLNNLDSKANMEHNEQLKGVIWEQCAEIRERISELNWTLKAPDIKQSSRIQYLTIVKRHKGDTNTILVNIEVYEKIRQTLSYVLAINEDGKLDDLVFFCKEILLRIDSVKVFRNDFATIDEIENAFKAFFRIELENEYEIFTSYFESEKKIKELHTLLKNNIKREN
jgi:hypothetical protein